MSVSSKLERRQKTRRRNRQLFPGILESLEWRLVPSTFVVNSAIDQPALDPSAGAETASGVITFRSAIQAANFHVNDVSGPDRIEFNIPGGGVQTIQIFPELPAITDPIIIDGYSQPGAKPNSRAVGSDAVLLINLNANRLGPSNGLTITAGNSTVRGLVMTYFPGDAINLADKGGNVIAGNYLGMPASGDVAMPNITGVGIGFGSDGNRIGGTDPADRNVIGGNVAGLRIVASSNNVVEGNYFGLEPSGMLQLGGQGQGNIIIKSGAPGVDSGPAAGNLIGGTVSGARNVMAAGGAGVILGGDQASLTTGNLIEGNYLGTDATGGGNATFHNYGPGVLLANGTGASLAGARMNTIGGTTPEARNVISNNNDGVVVESAATDNLIEGNTIGPDATGTVAMGNSNGISVQGNRTTIIGNLISGNGVDGILLQGGDESVILGNLIGTNATGTAALPNEYGVVLSGSRNVTLGGTTAQARNVISGNQYFGVLVEGSALGNRIQGNFIGTDILGTNGLGNAVNGITINVNQGDGQSSDTLIGGPEPGAGNTIAFNANNGVFIVNAARDSEADGSIDSNTIFANVLDGVAVTGLNVGSPHFQITRNSIFNNGRLGIDLGYDDVTPNDSMGHVGPNNFQNFPLLTAATVSSRATEVSGTLNSTPNTEFHIEFFANADLDPSDHGEGQTFLGFVNVTTDASGGASFSNVVLPPAPDGQKFVAATATDPGGNTSEFSTTVETSPAPAAADLAISMDAHPSTVEPGGDLAYTIIVTNNGPDAAENVILATQTPSLTTFQAMTVPTGWTAQEPSSGGTGTLTASIGRIDAGASAAFTVTVHVDSTVPAASTITCVATIASETADANQGNNQAEASAVVTQAVSAGVAVGITGNINPARVGQDVTYTVTATNPEGSAATGVVLHVTVPNTGTIVALGGGVRSTSGVDLAVGTLGAGAMRQFQIIVRPQQTGSLTLTASASADAGVNVGSPASVTTTVIGEPPGGTPTPSAPGEPTPTPSAPGEPTPTPSAPGEPTPPTDPGETTLLHVKRAVRYGFHHQPTILVVTFNKEWQSDARSNPATYAVLLSANGIHWTVPVERVYYDSGTHRATLRVSRGIYIYRPWRLVVGEQATQSSGPSVAGGSEGAAGGELVTRMSLRSLAGPASRAPGAAHVGIKLLPGGPLAARARRGARGHNSPADASALVARARPAIKTSQLAPSPARACRGTS
jgi:uncharacterized repeat protein (TIGR01451 family)